MKKRAGRTFCAAFTLALKYQDANARNPMTISSPYPGRPQLAIGAAPATATSVRPAMYSRVLEIDATVAQSARLIRAYQTGTSPPFERGVGSGIGEESLRFIDVSSGHGKIVDVASNRIGNDD